MPLMFSWMDSFIASYLLNTFAKMGSTFLKMTKSPTPSTGMIARNMSAIFQLMVNAMMTDTTSMMGLLTAMRMIIMNAFWMLNTSVVMRVTRLDAENLSMLAKENPCIAE